MPGGVKKPESGRRWDRVVEGPLENKTSVHKSCVDLTNLPEQPNIKLLGLIIYLEAKKHKKDLKPNKNRLVYEYLFPHICTIIMS